MTTANYNARIATLATEMRVSCSCIMHEAVATLANAYEASSLMDETDTRAPKLRAAILKHRDALAVPEIEIIKAVQALIQAIEGDAE